MKEEYQIYIYEGPVYHFDQLIEDKWHAKTYAPGERKAMSNLTYRYKAEHGLNRNADIYLDKNFLGKI